MEDYTYETSSFVRFRDADPMQMANHAVILSYLETTRTEFMMELLEIDRVAQINYVMARVECDYRSPASYGDILAVGARIPEVGKRSCVMEYRVEQEESGRLVAEAETVQVFFDYETQSTMEVPEDFRRRLRDVQAGSRRGPNRDPLASGDDHE